MFTQSYQAQPAINLDKFAAINSVYRLCPECEDEQSRLTGRKIVSAPGPFYNSEPCDLCSHGIGTSHDRGPSMPPATVGETVCQSPAVDDQSLCRGRKILHSDMANHQYMIVTKFETGTAPVRSFGGGVMTTGGGTIHYVTLDDDPTKCRRGSVPETVTTGLAPWPIHPGIMPENEVAELERLADENQKKAMQAREAARIEGDEIRRRGEEILAAKRPEWAKAAIIADLEEDQSDSQSDYFASRTARTVIIGWSKHTKDIFSEMRKSVDACGMPELSHLGTGKGIFRPVVVFADSYGTPGEHYHKGQVSPWHNELHGATHDRREFGTKEEAQAFIAQAGEPGGVTIAEGVTACFAWDIWETSVEHREKYSMGHGYYLGLDRYSGWQVRKTTGIDRLASIAGQPGGYMVPDEPAKGHRGKQMSSAAKPTAKAIGEGECLPAADATVTLNDDKHGVEIRFATIPSAETRDQLKAAGWRWSRFGQCWYAKQSPETLAFAASLAGNSAGNETIGNDIDRLPPAENKDESAPDYLNMTRDQAGKTTPEQARALLGHWWFGSEGENRINTKEGREVLHQVWLNYCHREDAPLHVLKSHLLGDQPAFDAHYWVAREVWKRENKPVEPHELETIPVSSQNGPETIDNEPLPNVSAGPMSPGCGQEISENAHIKTAELGNPVFLSTKFYPVDIDGKAIINDPQPTERKIAWKYPARIIGLPGKRLNAEKCYHNFSIQEPTAKENLPAAPDHSGEPAELITQPGTDRGPQMPCPEGHRGNGRPTSSLKVIDQQPIAWAA